MQLGWPLPKRKELIERLNKQPLRHVHTIYFQGKRQDLQIHSIPIELPKYRIDNGRTRSAQAAYLARHPTLPDDLFRSDIESDTTQRAQHEILKSMLGSADKDLLRFFKQRDQMQPLILTDIGIVVNGNRRLCAMRELIEQDKAANQPRFGNIDVVFLPPADERDIDKLEALYQLTEDIKEAYSWTAKAYMLRARQQEHGFDEQELSAIYQLPPPDVRDLISMLSLAEEYLDSRGKSNQYELVDGDEFAFRQLLKSREKKKSEGDKEALKQLAFCVIDKWEFGRLYSVIPKIGDNLEEVRGALAKEFTVKSSTKESKAASLLGVKSIPVDAISSVLEDDASHDLVRMLVSEVLDAAEDRGRERRRGNLLLSRMTRAHTLLASTLADWTAAKDARSLDSKMKQIEDVIKVLREKIDAAAKN